MQRCVLAMPPLRPLILVLKALLRDSGGGTEHAAWRMGAYTPLVGVSTNMRLD